MVSSGITSIPPIIMGVPSIGPTHPGTSGSFPTTHTYAGVFPPMGGPTSTTTFLIIPPFVPGVSGPSTSIPTIPTIPVTIPPVKSQPYPTPVTHGNYILTIIDTMAGPS